MRFRVVWLTFSLAAHTAFARRCKPRPKPSTPSSIESVTLSTSSQATNTIDVPSLITPSSLSTASIDETTILTPTDTITINPTPPTTPTILTTTPTASFSTSTSTTISTLSTSAAPLPSPTFSILGSGDGPVNGSPLQGISQDGTLLIFNPNFSGTTTRNFILDPITGRVRDRDNGFPVCAYYGYSTTTSRPAYVAYCQNGNTGRDSLYDYLTCQVVSGKLSCTSPQAACTDDDDLQTTCTTSPGSEVNNQFYYRYSANGGDYLYISSGMPNGYTPVDLIVQEM